jgi:hypothetical protein
MIVLKNSIVFRKGSMTGGRLLVIGNKDREIGRATRFVAQCLAVL